MCVSIETVTGAPEQLLLVVETMSGCAIQPFHRDDSAKDAAKRLRVLADSLDREAGGITLEDQLKFLNRKCTVLGMCIAHEQNRFALICGTERRRFDTYVAVSVFLDGCLSKTCGSLMVEEQFNFYDFEKPCVVDKAEDLEVE